MKRSRAVYLITAAMTHLGLTNSPDYDIYDEPTIEQGEKLLTIIEKSIGMQPPASGWTGDETIYEWEPENGE